MSKGEYTVISGEAEGVYPGEEVHCRTCQAVERYCPTHKFDDQWRRLRGGKFATMMPPAPGIVAVRGGTMGGNRPSATGWGYYSGDPAARWSPDGTRMHLLEPFTYTDRRAKPWTAPRGAVLDGASIPRAFWTLVGSPYRGRYRYAAIVHDYHCNAREEPWDHVHYMFYEACMAAGTSHTLAKVLYYAVLHFGPRWRRMHESNEPLATPKIMPQNRWEVLRVERWIVENDPTPEVIAASPPQAIGFPRTKPRRK